MIRHQEVSEEMIERYIRRELAGEERRTFEEHLLECPDCFAEVEIAERFAAGVRNAVRVGHLPQSAAPAAPRWLAVALAAGLAAVLVSGGVWIIALRRSLGESLQARQALESQLAEARRKPAQPLEIAAGNLPIAILKADRAAGGESVLQVPAGAQEIALWMDVEPGDRYRSFAVVLTGATDVLVAVRGLVRNGEGAVAAVLPAAKLPPGRYTVRLSSESPPRLLAQYNLRITMQ